jgi:integration host factor subunit beta
MLKSQPVLNVAGRLLQIRRRDVEKAIDAVLDEIVAALARKDRVELRGFGAAFSAKVRAGRIGRNPKTTVKVLVDEKRIPVCSPSKEMHKRLNSVAPVLDIPV